MGRKRKNGLSEEKRNIIGQLIELYDIQSAADIQEALKDLLGGTIQSMLETELEEQVESREESDSEYHNSRNGYKPKPLRSNMGEIPIQAPRDRNRDFEPQAAPKYQKNISEIEGKIIATLCFFHRRRWESEASLHPRRRSILAFSQQPAKAKLLKRWLRSRSSAGATSDSGNHARIAVRPLTENLEHGCPGISGNSTSMRL